MRVDARPRQWVGVALLLGTCAVMALVLPRWAAASAPATGTELTAGDAVSVGGVSIVPDEGWTSESTDFLSVHKQEGALTIFPVTPVAGSPEDQLAASAEAYKADTSTTYDIGTPEEFTTESGLQGYQLVVLSPGEALVSYVFTDGDVQATGTFSSTDRSWKSLHDEVSDMVMTVEFTDADAATSGSES
ncbi:hypothetical protein GCM10025865_27220 [Paraoerskovia sediminicola]|uniref:PsbP C-terminal domain-containing protein n=1 Tax=Paraoerskovia sediminicola TaxID=1138587 RepID=A0ABM8G5I7_9CELL|nr:hypothetical protein [Paraoerskovia sediminicola]BDZ43423.1 hypothetical protein GCM10025865_27220 [Paraoerskovia sediminicola]